ncbi:MAG: PTS sugar transporter subunit IIA, partial [Thermodesulfobacteriota bacterium]
MRILDVLEREAVLFELKSSDKKGVLEELVAPIADKFAVDQSELVRILLERERLGSTGIGGGIGIPHGKMKDLDRLILGFGLSKKGVSFESIDGRPTHI